MESAVGRDKYRLTVHRIRSTIIDRARNDLARRAINSGSKYMFCIDGDMLFSVKDFYHLLDLDLDIVSGVCATRPIQGFMVKDEDVKIAAYFRNKWDELSSIVDFPWLDAETEEERSKLDPLLEVDGVGAAFLCVKTDVLKDMAEYDKSLGGGPFSQFRPLPWMPEPLGEDMSFSWRAREKGYKIHLDQRVLIGHVGEYAYSYYDFREHSQEFMKKNLAKLTEIKAKLYPEFGELKTPEDYFKRGIALKEEAAKYSIKADPGEEIEK